MKVGDWVVSVGSSGEDIRGRVEIAAFVDTGRGEGIMGKNKRTG